MGFGVSLKDFYGLGAFNAFRSYSQVEDLGLRGFWGFEFTKFRSSGWVRGYVVNNVGVRGYVANNVGVVVKMRIVFFGAVY